MILNSFSFLVFFAIIFILFWKISKKYQWILLLLAGYYFYASWKPAYLGLILLTTLINYYCAIAIYRQAHRKRRYLLVALFLNLSALFIFKYFNFFSLTLNQVLKVNLPQFKFLLPLGISFYTLQVIGYLFDVYKGKIQPEKHLGFFALFVCFFPQLSAGPIERGGALLPQLKKQYSFDYVKVAGGLKLFTYGLFKKMVIADNLGIVVDRVFNSLPEYKGLSLVLVVFFYTWQIYMDFSGYTDMARGVGKMLGIELMENFNFPYFADSVRDFWKRWHISLTSWLRDYIYIPLGGNRHGWIKMLLSTILVFTVSGLWHGAGIHFVIWGTLNGIWMVGERIVQFRFGKVLRVPRILKIAYAYVMISIFWIFFRAVNLSDALYILRNSIMGIKNFIQPNYIWASLNQLFIFNRVEMIITFSLLIIVITGEFIRTKISLEGILSKQPAVARFVFFCIVAFLIIQLRNSDIKEFIYTRF